MTAGPDRSPRASRRRRPLASGTIQSLRRGLQVLDLIAEQGGRLSLTEIARRLAGIGDAVAGYGRLFALPVPPEGVEPR